MKMSKSMNREAPREGLLFFQPKINSPRFPQPRGLGRCVRTSDKSRGFLLGRNIMDPQESKYPGALSLIKKDLENLVRLGAFLRYLGDLNTDGNITLRSEMLSDLAGKVEDAADSIHYELDPSYQEDVRVAEARAVPYPEAQNGDS